MVIDTSALLAVLSAEPDRHRFAAALARTGIKLISSVNALESAMVVEARRGPAAGRELDLLMHQAKIDIVPADEALFVAARSVWRKFGKGNHPASLNICDCCSLALSQISGRPLLYKGDDFGRTGVRSALDS